MIGKYSVIYADPPWSYKDKCNSGERGVTFKYSTLTVGAVCALRINDLHVSEIASPNAALLLWVPAPLTVEALGPVMAAWGFKFKTKAFCWRKLTKHGKEHIGMGNNTRANTEDCWLGIRGKMPRQDAGVRQLLSAGLREHSRKPDEIRDAIVRLYGDVPRIELFSRAMVPGWDMWGNDIDPELRVVHCAKEPTNGTVTV